MNKKKKETSPQSTKIQTCRQCGASGTGNFCSECGQAFTTERITITTILYEVFNFFTNLDRGFFYTVKRLAVAPGKMQREYIEGQRSRYQKPFSTFFLCGTITAFALYLIYLTGDKGFFNESRGEFMRQYYVLVQAALLPFYSLIIWLFFSNHKINYAESLVYFAYTLSSLLLIVIFTNIFDISNHRIPTKYYEIPILLVYFTWSNLNFFAKEPKWKVVLKSILVLLICYFLSNFVGDHVMEWL